MPTNKDKVKVFYRIDQEIAPNPALFNDYIDRNPVSRSVQVSGEMAENEVSETFENGSG